MSFFETIFAQLPEAVILTDKRYRVASLNNKAEELLGVSEAEAQGIHFSELLKSPQLFSLLQETLNLSRAPNLTYENSTVVFEKRGKKKFYKASMVPLITFTETRYVLTTLTDITMLKEIEQYRTDFFATASHEFRTPLTSILMGVGIIKTGQLGELSSRGKEILEAIDEDCARLLRLANNMLDLSRMETGSISLEREDASVYEIVKAALGTLRLQAENRNITLFTQLSPDLPPIQVDINKIIWVLTNLVGNALRYTNEGGSVTVKAIRKGTRLFFSVVDTGKGIPQEYHETIFKKFTQIKDKEFSSGGAGLGLAICKEIVEAHGGEIWVKSAVGRGSAFTFSIPIGRS